MGALTAGSLVLLIVWVRKRNRQDQRDMVRRPQVNRQMTYIYGHLNRHNASLATTAPTRSTVYQQTGRTPALRELDIEEVLLPIED